jgi:hypothetical protein
MDTTDHVLLIILTTLLSLFFLICIAVVTGLYKLIAELRVIVARAEDVVDSVEAATEALKHTGDRVALFKLMKTVFNISQKKKGRK